MRTTLSIDDDVLQEARAAAAKRKIPFKTLINEALRAGLPVVAAPPKSVPYVTRPHAMGLRPGIDLDNIQELLARLEGEDAR